MNLRTAVLKGYLRIGMHAAPPGTLLYYAHRSVLSLANIGQSSKPTRGILRRSPHGGTRYYDIDLARRTRQVDGLALVFFMGLGDYLMTTPMIEALRLAYPDLPMHAYASSNNDWVNSALVIHLLRANPMFEQVGTYRGYPGMSWTNYDFRDALRIIPKNFLILPVVYELLDTIQHRETTLLETFGLPVRLPVRGPLLYPGPELTAPAISLQAEIRQRLASSPARQVVCCHLGARSSGYEYPYVEQLIRALLAENCLVIHFGKSEQEHDNLIEVDVTTITPNDTISLLRTLKDESPSLRLISVNSFMWPVSAGLGIPNLGIHVFWDSSVHQYHYPNTFVISQHTYPRISPGRLFLAPIGSFRESMSRFNVNLTDFDAPFVMHCYRRFVELT
jgi:ADP-heptose:LPS heptosyltransferase